MADNDATDDQTPQSLDSDEPLDSTSIQLEESTEELNNDIQHVSEVQENVGSVTENPYAHLESIERPRPEPETLVAWREELKLRLRQQDEREENEIKEMKEKARKDLEEWYRRHDEQVMKNKENRLTENECLTQRKSFSGSEGSWERISNLCDFNPKNSKCTKDVSRMRSIFINLKKNQVVIN